MLPSSLKQLQARTSLTSKNRSSVNHKCRLAISIDRNNIHLSSVYMRVEAYRYFIRVMLSNQIRIRLLLLCNIRACRKSESLNSICCIRRRKAIINLWQLNHEIVKFYLYPWNKKFYVNWNSQITTWADLMRSRGKIIMERKGWGFRLMRKQLWCD